VDTLRDDEASADASDDQGDDPAEGGLAEHELVDALGALEERDAGGGADLAVGGREREAEVGADDDDDGGAKLDGEAARGGDDGELDADGLDRKRERKSQERERATIAIPVRACESV